MTLNELPCPNCTDGVTFLTLLGPYGGTQPIAFRCPCPEGDKRIDLPDIPDAIRQKLLYAEALPKEKPLTAWGRIIRRWGMK